MGVNQGTQDRTEGHGAGGVSRGHSASRAPLVRRQLDFWTILNGQDGILPHYKRSRNGRIQNVKALYTFFIPILNPLC